MDPIEINETGDEPIEMSIVELIAQFPMMRDEGMTPGHTACIECGFVDLLVLNCKAEAGDACVEMDCHGCGARTKHDFTPFKP
jgi:hypothetical protein